jgi:hypothetical protein
MADRNKTHKQRAAAAAAFTRNAPQGTSTDETPFTKALEDGVQGAYRRPWHRLERGLRLNRLRLFAETEAIRTGLQAAEQAALLLLLQKALDRKQLNSKTTVVYDQEAEEIKEIKGLVMHRGGDGVMRFQIVEKKVGMTFRKKRGAAAVAVGEPLPDTAGQPAE